MLQTKAVEEIRTHIICSAIFFFWKSCHLLANVEKYGRARQATGDSIIWHTHIACCITKATDTHSGYVILSPPPTLTTGTQKCLSVTLYLLRLSCLDVSFICSGYAVCCELVSCLKSNNVTDLCYLKFENKF